MERTIYSKYSNERARRFCIRTDITIDDAGEKKVYKRALAPEGDAHIAGIVDAYQQLEQAYEGSGIDFCLCERVPQEADAGARASVRFSYLSGKSLQDVVKQALVDGDDAKVEGILHEYIRKVGAGGGEKKFIITDEFEEVFGEKAVADIKAYMDMQETQYTSALTSDIDMIFSNIFVDETDCMTPGAMWQIIDYEWTFDFPIPKEFLIYRALYFAYYQILCESRWSLQKLFDMANITEQQAQVFQEMEEGFQRYMSADILPVRNMQRVMGTKIITLSELMDFGGGKHGASDAGIMEGEWIRVRKIQYHVDRNEYQDGARVCSGWAVAKTWDGRMLPVNIQVIDEVGNVVSVDLSRRERKDVATVLNAKRVTHTNWGFDCVWVTAETMGGKIRFSLGDKECIYTM